VQALRHDICRIRDGSDCSRWAEREEETEELAAANDEQGEKNKRILEHIHRALMKSEHVVQAGEE